MAEWGFLTNHARVLLCIAHDPGVRLRDIAARTGVTERTAYGIVTDLTEAGDSQPSAKPWHSSPASSSAQPGCLPGTRDR